jgi:hypothetical protein
MRQSERITFCGLGIILVLLTGLAPQLGLRGG